MLQEIQDYLTELDDLRNQVKGLLEGLPQDALDWRPIKDYQYLKRGVYE